MPSSSADSLLKRNPKSTLFCLTVLMSLFILVLLEYIAGTFFGLGKTVIYDAHPIYGYRPKPSQTVARRKSHNIHINNLGLRADQDWDIQNFQNKILFLGDSVTYGGSYIDNTELFSHLALNSLPNYISGNGAVNDWGVNNVYGLVKGMEFLPAKIYVNVFHEEDFYRGLQRIGGEPFWTKKPRFALEELFHYFIYMVNLQKMPITHSPGMTVTEKMQIAEPAVRNLKDLDDYLKSHHRIHHIYITPSRAQVEQDYPTDLVLKKLLEQYGLQVVYLKNRIETLSPNEKIGLFHDSAHLSKKGHTIWAKIIATDLQDLKNDEYQNT